MGSAKFADSKVNHNQIMIWNSKRMCSPPVARSRINMTVVSAVTISSTNITGFAISVRGLSLTKAEPIAGTTIFGSNSAEPGMLFGSVEVSIEATPSLVRGIKSAGVDRELLDDRAECERREEGKTADD